MGASISQTRDSIVRPFAFPAPSPSYDKRMPGLKWIEEIPIYWNRINSNRPTLIYSHGNGCDLGQTKPLVDLLVEKLKVNVLAYEYPGYGIHQGEASEQGCYETIERVHSYLVRKKIQSIILIGQSLGTGPTSWLAKRLCRRGEPPPLIILLTPFTSAVGVVNPTMAAVSYSSHIISERTLDLFDNYYHLKSVTSPVQIIAGDEDSVTPYSHACELQKILKNPLPMITLRRANHNDLFHSYYVDRTLAGIRQAIEEST